MKSWIKIPNFNLIDGNKRNLSTSIKAKRSAPVDIWICGKAHREQFDNHEDSIEEERRRHQAEEWAEENQTPAEIVEEAADD